MLQSTPIPPAAPTTEAQGPTLVRIVPHWVNRHIIDTLGPIDALDGLTLPTVEQ
jgi:hypothetical protein